MIPKHVKFIESTTKYRPQPATVVKLSSGMVTVAPFDQGHEVKESALYLITIFNASLFS